MRTSLVILVVSLWTAPALAGTWRDALLAEAARERVAHPELAARLTELEGLDPGHYAARRRPEPEVGRELSRLRLPAALLAERLWSLDLARPLEPEEEALAVGLLVALGDSSHLAAPKVLEAVLSDARAASELRQTAAVALGARGAAAPLVVLLNDHKADLALRVAAARGLGRVRSAEAVTALAGGLGAREPAELRRAAAMALGRSGSAWAGTPEHRARAAAALAGALGRERDRSVTLELVTALGMTGEGREALRGVADDAARDEASRAAARRALAR